MSNSILDNTIEIPPYVQVPLIFNNNVDNANLIHLRNHRWFNRNIDTFKLWINYDALLNDDAKNRATNWFYTGFMNPTGGRKSFKRKSRKNRKSRKSKKGKKGKR